MNGNESTLIKQDFPVSWMYKSGNVEYLSIPYIHGDICIFGLPLSEVDNEFTVTDFPKKLEQFIHFVLLNFILILTV